MPFSPDRESGFFYPAVVSNGSRKNTPPLFSLLKYNPFSKEPKDVSFTLLLPDKEQPQRISRDLQRGWEGEHLTNGIVGWVS